jgi:hypothetical protein
MYIYIPLSIICALHVVHTVCLCFFRVILMINAAFFLQKGISQLTFIIDMACIFCEVGNELCDIVQVRCTLHKGNSLNLAGVVCECCLIHLTVLTTRNTSATVLVYPVLPAPGRTLLCLKVPRLRSIVPSDNRWWWRWAWTLEEWRLTRETRSAVRETNLCRIYYMDSSGFEHATLRWEASHQPP